MVNAVGGSPPQVSIQPSAAQQQEVRQRNEQTQPRQAPPADAQRNTLQTRGDDQRKQQQLAAQQRRQQQSEGAERPENSRRGQLVDLVA
jgi:hypothetical protein